MRGTENPEILDRYQVSPLTEGMPAAWQSVLKTDIQGNTWGFDISTFRKLWDKLRARGRSVKPNLEGSNPSYLT